MKIIKDAFHILLVVYVTYPILSYDERLVLFGLERLELRRLKCDLSYLKLLMVLLHVVYIIVYNLLKIILCTIRDGIVINKIDIRTYKNSFKYYFMNLIAHVWNYLPDNYFNTQLIGSFKA